MLEQPRLDLVGGHDPAGLDLGGEEARRRERTPVLGADPADGAEDAALGAEDAAVGIAERPRVGL
jgi:hypothetical protein